MENNWGLASDEYIKEYIIDVKAIFSKWYDLSEKEQLSALEKAINKQLKKEGVFSIELFVKPLDGKLGEFDYKEWHINLGLNNYNNFDQRVLAVTLYHEARHAEQFFAVSRYAWALDDEKFPDAINQDVAQATRDNPMVINTLFGLRDLSPKYEIASAIYKNTFGDNSARTNHLYSVMAENRRRMREIEYELQALRSRSTKYDRQKIVGEGLRSFEKVDDYKLGLENEYHQLRKFYEENIKQYELLPSEDDAFAIEDKFDRFWGAQEEKERLERLLNNY